MAMVTGSVTRRTTSQAVRTRIICRWFTFMGSAGDIDGNGVVNVMDVRLLMMHVNDSTGYPVDLWTGNVDGGCGIDNVDVQRLLAHVFASDSHPLMCS